MLDGFAHRLYSLFSSDRTEEVAEGADKRKPAAVAVPAELAYGRLVGEGEGEDGEVEGRKPVSIRAEARELYDEMTFIETAKKVFKNDHHVSNYVTRRGEDKEWYRQIVGLNGVVNSFKLGALIGETIMNIPTALTAQLEKISGLGFFLFAGRKIASVVAGVAGGLALASVNIAAQLAFVVAAVASGIALLGIAAGVAAVGATVAAGVIVATYAVQLAVLVAMAVPHALYKSSGLHKLVTGNPRLEAPDLIEAFVWKRLLTKNCAKMIHASTVGRFERADLDASGKAAKSAVPYTINGNDELNGEMLPEAGEVCDGCGNTSCICGSGHVDERVRSVVATSSSASGQIQKPRLVLVDDAPEAVN